MRQIGFLLGLGLIGCEGGPAAGDDSGAPDESDGADSEDSPEDSGDDSEAPAVTDADRVRALLAGQAIASEVIQQVAWSGGWPVQTDAGTWLFVHEADGGDWGLAGDFNGWTPLPMARAGDVYFAEIEVPAPVGAAYKFVEGGSATWIADPGARAFDYDAFGAKSFVRPPLDWHLQRWPALAAEGLAPRHVDVLVPPGVGPWPVLYAHDGQNLFDPAALGGGWRLRETVPALSAPILVVGVHHAGVDRIDEYAHTTDVRNGGSLGGKGDQFVALLDEHLRPHVEAVYGSTGVDGLIGSSMGGLSSLHVAHDRPGRYDFVASLSGSLWFGRLGASNPAMQELWLADAPPDVVVYADSGGDDGGDGCTDPDGDGFFEDDPNDSDGYCVSRAFVDALAADGFTWGETLHHWHAPGALHQEAAWAARVSRPLDLFVALASP